VCSVLYCKKDCVTFPPMNIDLSEWWAVGTVGGWFCGRRDAGSRRLLDLQLLQMPLGLVPGPGGMPRPHIQVISAPWVVEELVVPEGSIWISCAAMDDPERWRLVIGSTEKLKIESRSGLWVPPVPGARAQ